MPSNARFKPFRFIPPHRSVPRKKSSRTAKMSKKCKR
jgi:hypothetical protein